MHSVSTLEAYRIHPWTLKNSLEHQGTITLESTYSWKRRNMNFKHQNEIIGKKMLTMTLSRTPKMLDIIPLTLQACADNILFFI